MSDLPLGNVPTSTLDDTDNLIFAEGSAARKVPYGDAKKDIVGEATLITKAQKPKEAINELANNLLESTGYGVISGLTVSAQSTANMTVNVASGIVDMATGARLTPSGNSALTISTADATNPRIDIIYVNTDATIGYLSGTPAASPTVPTTPTGVFVLAQISVAANTTTIISSNITDKRKMKNTTDNLAASLSENAQNLAIHKSEVVSEVLYVSRDLSLEGSQTITLETNAVPNFIRITGVVQGTKKMCITEYSKANSFGRSIVMHPVSGQWGFSGSFIIKEDDATTNYTTATIGNILSGSFQLQWSKNSTTGATGTVYLIIECSYH